MSGCNYDGENFSGQLLHSSRMVETLFRDATLINTDLSSSNLRDARFNRANLCDADLSSSTLRNTVFRNANLTKADLHSSACGGADFTGAKFCQTIDCNGDLRNDHCGVGIVCCVTSECPAGFICGSDNICFFDPL